MRNERPKRLSEEIKKNVKQLELTWTKLGCDFWNPQKDFGMEDKGPNLYTRPCALFDDMDTSEDE